MLLFDIVKTIGIMTSELILTDLIVILNPKEKKKNMTTSGRGISLKYESAVFLAAMNNREMCMCTCVEIH